VCGENGGVDQGREPALGVGTSDVTGVPTTFNLCDIIKACLVVPRSQRAREGREEEEEKKQLLTFSSLSSLHLSFSLALEI